MLNTLLLLFRTVRHLKLRQVAFQVWYRVRPTPKIAYSSEVVAKQRLDWQGHRYASQSYFPQNTFDFLNSSFELKSVDDWNNPSVDKLWLYNLHYFDDLNAINCEERVTQQRDLILQWIDQNPVMQGNGWEPYPLSLRIVNWIKWCWRNPEFADKLILNSLHTQVNALEKQLEFHILANHLFANIKALIFAGQFFEGNDSQRWLRVGQRLLRQELKEQFLSDGAHFERSPMYHCILMWDLLDLYCLFRHSEIEKESFDEQLKNRIENGLSWLNNMIHPDGEIPFFNDTTFGIAPSVAHIQQYASLLGVQPNKTELTQSGFFRREIGAYALIADIGKIEPRYQPGHAHAETASFELSVSKQRVFVNSGINEYGMSAERLMQRSTAAHNAVEACWSTTGVNSSEVWSGFRVARRAKVNSIVTQNSIECRIRGFWRSNKSAVHTRKFDLGSDAKPELMIHDSLCGAEAGVAHFHLHPNCQVTTVESNRVEIGFEGGSVNLVFGGNATQVTVENFNWYPGFGKKQSSKKILVQFKDELVTTISS